MPADLDSLTTALYVSADDFLPARTGPGRQPRSPTQNSSRSLLRRSSSAAIGAAVLARRATATGASVPLHPAAIGLQQADPGARASISLVIAQLARVSPSFCDRIRLLDSTPVPCGASRETVKRSDLAGWAAYGYCASHSRYFWGLRLYLCCAPDGMPISFCLAPRTSPSGKSPQRCSSTRAATGCSPARRSSSAIRASAAEFEEIVASLDATFIRPDRKNEPKRFGNLGGVDQWIESVNDTLKGQLSLEEHGGHSPKASGPASANAYSPSPPASGTTGCCGKPATSTPPAAISPPTTTDPVKTESLI